MSNYLLWKNSFYGSCRSEPFSWRYFAKRCSEKLGKIHVKHLCSSLLFNKAPGYQATTPFVWNISERLLLADILLKSYLESFWKIPQKTTLKIMLQILDLKLYENTILARMFSYKYLEFFRTTFPLKTLCDFLWMESKTFPKICD